MKCNPFAASVGVLQICGEDAQSIAFEKQETVPYCGV